MKELKSIENMNFEEALIELEAIVNKIDSGTQDLETSINNFERGNLLRKHCEKKLKEAQLKIETITKNENGEIKFEEFKI